MFPRKSLLTIAAIFLAFMIIPMDTSAGSPVSIQLELPDLPSAIIQKSKETMEELQAEVDSATLKAFRNLSVALTPLREKATDTKLTTFVSRSLASGK